MFWYFYWFVMGICLGVLIMIAILHIEASFLDDEDALDTGSLIDLMEFHGVLTSGET